DTLERKLESIRCYQTQFPPAKEYVFDRVESVARATGAEAGLGAGELFFTTRPLVSHDLVTTVLGG
ncbi:MAG: LmbE family protein, partial [Pirellulaceae bacterium]